MPSNSGPMTCPVDGMLLVRLLAGSGFHRCGIQGQHGRGHKPDKRRKSFLAELFD